MGERLQVYWEKALVGDLRLNDQGDFLFQYSTQWVDNSMSEPLSIRLPLRSEPYPDEVCNLFFSNLLPEGRVRSLIARKLGISEANTFALLKALGGDCAGAISVLPDGQDASDLGDYDLITPAELEILIQAMAVSPLLVGKDNLRLSLAGAQQKLPVYVEDNKIYLPRGSYPSSHILKPKVFGFDGIVENEVFCMTLAKRVGLSAPEAKIYIVKQPVYLVERYDRKRDSKNRLVRIHQEDFCQALGYIDSRKYEAESGPNLQKCFSLISEHGTQPILDKKAFIQWVIFNVLIGNCDAHAKNISMLMTNNEYRLAPFYDLISTVVYPSLSAKLAMSVGGEVRPAWIMPRHWERLAQDAGVGVKAVSALCGELIATLPKAAALLAAEFPAQHSGQGIIRKICNNISAIAKRIS